MMKEAEEDQLERYSQMVLDKLAKTSWQMVYRYQTYSTAVTYGPGTGTGPSAATALQYSMQGFQDPSRAYALLQDVTIRSTRTIMTSNCDPE